MTPYDRDHYIKSEESLVNILPIGLKLILTDIIYMDIIMWVCQSEVGWGGSWKCDIKLF